MSLFLPDISHVNQEKSSVCYLAEDFSQVSLFDTDESFICCPENLRNAQQIKDWVHNLKKFPQHFATCSLFLLRELYIQNVNVYYVNITKNKVYEGYDVDNIGNIEILDRELTQADVYINKI